MINTYEVPREMKRDRQEKEIDFSKVIDYKETRKV